MAYEVPDLPYDYNALEPHIDEQTMKVHHDKHHQAYVDKANDALEGTKWAEEDVNEVLQNLSKLPDDKQGPVRNNGGGHSNHTFFWEIMSPDGGGEPDGDLADAIKEGFGSFSSFQEEFVNAILVKAPHPNAAKVFTDFLFAKTAQQILADDGLYVPNEEVTYPKGKLPLKELKLIKVEPEEMQKRDEEIKKKFRELFGV